MFAPAAPPAVRAGAPLPPGCDAVLPPHALARGLQGTGQGAGAEILQSVAPGHAMREAGEEIAADGLLVAAGDWLRGDRIGLLALAGVARVALRSPIVGVEAAADDPLGAMMSSLAETAGATRGGGDTADLTIVLGAPGHAGTAAAARRLAAGGRLLVHGLALRPGEAIGFGTQPRAGADARLVVIVPSRFDDAMAAWLLFVEPWLAQASGLAWPRRATTLPLSRRIASAPGLADLVLLRRGGTEAAPLWDPIATGDLPWSAFARAQAFCVIPAESEGLPAGAPLTAMPFSQATGDAMAWTL